MFIWLNLWWQILQISLKRLVRGCEKFVLAFAYLFCRPLPRSCLARFAYLLADLCTNLNCKDDLWSWSLSMDMVILLIKVAKRHKATNLVATLADMLTGVRLSRKCPISIRSNCCFYENPHCRLCAIVFNDIMGENWAQCINYQEN